MRRSYMSQFLIGKVPLISEDERMKGVTQSQFLIGKVPLGTDEKMELLHDLVSIPYR